MAQSNFFPIVNNNIYITVTYILNIQKKNQFYVHSTYIIFFLCPPFISNIIFVQICIDKDMVIYITYQS